MSRCIDCGWRYSREGRCLQCRRLIGVDKGGWCHRDQHEPREQDRENQLEDLELIEDYQSGRWLL